MLITKKVETKWNSKTKKYYEEKGYVYTKMKDTLIVDVHDLKDSSSIYVEVECDYCGKIYKILWSHRINMTKSEPNHKDCCKNCTYKKAKETLNNRYGVDNPMYIDEVKLKLQQTNLEKYGCENVFQNDDIKEKIKQTNLDKYGVESYAKTEECQEKKMETCLLKYGETSHMKINKYRLMFAREKSPVWKGGIRTKRTERITLEYKEWRRSVFKRDDYTCCKCHQKGGKLQAHHILSWKINEELRYEIENGITMCEECHREFHKLYGKTSANRDDLLEFIQHR